MIREISNNIYAMHTCLCVIYILISSKKSIKYNLTNNFFLKQKAKHESTQKTSHHRVIFVTSYVPQNAFDTSKTPRVPPSSTSPAETTVWPILSGPTTLQHSRRARPDSKALPASALKKYKKRKDAGAINCRSNGRSVPDYL